MTSHSVFAVDPGGVTGWAWAKVEGGVIVDSRRGQVECRRDEIKGTDRILNLMRYANDVCPLNAIVVEDFILRLGTKDRSLLSPVRLTAMLEYGLSVDSDLMDLLPIVLQSPSDAKSTITDDRLKLAGMWIRGLPHARDATRHLLLYLRKLDGGIG
jgi:hypothetical protein